MYACCKFTNGYFVVKKCILIVGIKAFWHTNDIFCCCNFRPDKNAHDLNNAKIYNQNTTNIEKGNLKFIKKIIAHLFLMPKIMIDIFNHLTLVHIFVDTLKYKTI